MKGALEMIRTANRLQKITVLDFSSGYSGSEHKFHFSATHTTVIPSVARETLKQVDAVNATLNESGVKGVSITCDYRDISTTDAKGRKLTICIYLERDTWFQKEPEFSYKNLQIMSEVVDALEKHKIYEPDAFKPDFNVEKTAQDVAQKLSSVSGGLTWKPNTCNIMEGVSFHIQDVMPKKTAEKVVSNMNDALGKVEGLKDVKAFLQSIGNEGKNYVKLSYISEKTLQDDKIVNDIVSAMEEKPIYKLSHLKGVIKFCTDLFTKEIKL